MDFSLQTLYLICATVGGGLLVIQLILMLIGMDDGGDGDLSDFELDEAGVGGNLFFGHLSMKTVVAFLTFFGLVGLLIETSEWGISPAWGAGIASAAGLVAFYVVAVIMIGLHRLQSAGNVDLHDGVGKMATVYLKIPSEKTGAGKVTVHLQKRSLEVPAITDGEEIATGSQVRIIGITGGSVFEVVHI